MMIKKWDKGGTCKWKGKRIERNPHWCEEKKESE